MYPLCSVVNVMKLHINPAMLVTHPLQSLQSMAPDALDRADTMKRDECCPSRETA